MIFSPNFNDDIIVISTHNVKLNRDKKSAHKIFSTNQSTIKSEPQTKLNPGGTQIQPVVYLPEPNTAELSGEVPQFTSGVLLNTGGSNSTNTRMNTYFKWPPSSSTISIAKPLTNASVPPSSRNAALPFNDYAKFNKPIAETDF